MVQVLFYLSNNTVLDMDDLVGLVGHTAFVCYYDDGHALVSIQTLQQLHHLYRRLRVQSASRLIGQDNLWFCDECTGVMSARAIATRCFCPPDSSLG